jgi:hypothetical protein
MGNNANATVLIQRAERELEQLRASIGSNPNAVFVDLNNADREGFAEASETDFLTSGLAPQADLPFGADEQDAPEVEASTTVEFVTLKIKRTYPKRLINIITAANPDVELNENEADAYVLTGSYIKVTRAEVESVVGRLTDTRWRMLFMNRTGEVREFNNYEFSMGVPRPVITESSERRESTQINVRIPTDLKALMEELRAPEILNLSQNDFVAEALAEYINMIKKERI